MMIDMYSLADWFWCRGEPFGTCKLDSQLRLFLTGSGTWAAMDERVRLGRLRRNFSATEKDRNGAQAKWSASHSFSQLTLVLHHVGLQVMAVALQRVARLLQAADDGLRGTSAVAVVNRTGRRAGARRVSRRGAGRVSRGGAEAIGGQVEGWVHGLLFILQTVSVQLLVTKGAAPQWVTGGTRAPPGRRGSVLLPQTCSSEGLSSATIFKVFSISTRQVFSLQAGYR